MFTRHAPSILNRIKQFDEEFNSILGNTSRKDTKELTIKKIEQLIKEIENELTSIAENGESIGVISIHEEIIF